MSDLKDYLPERLLSAPVVNLEDAFQPVIDEIAQSFAEITEYELFAQNTARWIGLWETAYGIMSDPSKPIDERRSRLMSKMRGSGTTTVEMIRRVVSSFANSVCEIIEHPESYRFDIKFLGSYGLPPNMDDVTAAIEEIKPAHLAYMFIILYRTWGEVAYRTWGDLSSYTWKQVKEGEI